MLSGGGTGCSVTLQPTAERRCRQCTTTWPVSLFRFFAGLLAILATYDFLSYFLSSLSARRLGLLLVTLGGGLGWVLILLARQSWLGALPLELYSPETFGFLSLYGIPHLALARALMLWAILIYLRGQSDPLGLVRVSLLPCGCSGLFNR
jgi:hypothetical protein